LKAFFQSNIADPLANPDAYEISESGTAVVQRFIHLNGCKNNSFGTYLKSFCQHKHINLFYMADSFRFDREDSTFDYVYALAKRNMPCIVYIANHDEFLFDGPMNAKFISSFTQQCKKVRSNRYAIWTILRSNIPNLGGINPLAWDFFQYFSRSSYDLPMQNPTDVCAIFKHCLEKYLPDHKLDPVRILTFSMTSMRFCTYLQIEDFVRTVIFAAQSKMTDNERLSNARPNIQSMADFSAYVSVIQMPGGTTVDSIVPYSAENQNVKRFKAIPPPPIPPT
jgi:hypothetical protein